MLFSPGSASCRTKRGKRRRHFGNESSAKYSGRVGTLTQPRNKRGPEAFLSALADRRAAARGAGDFLKPPQDALNLSPRIFYGRRGESTPHNCPRQLPNCMKVRGRITTRSAAGIWKLGEIVKGETVSKPNPGTQFSLRSRSCVASWRGSWLVLGVIFVEVALSSPTWPIL